MPIKDGVQKHLIQGGTARHEHTTPLDDVMRQYDFGGEVNFPNPMDPDTAGVGPGTFESQTFAQIQAQTTAQHVGLDSAAVNGEPVDVLGMSENTGGAGGGKSASTYGDRNTGKS